MMNVSCGANMLNFAGTVSREAINAVNNVYSVNERPSRVYLPRNDPLGHGALLESLTK